MIQEGNLRPVQGPYSVQIFLHQANLNTNIYTHNMLQQELIFNLTEYFQETVYLKFPPSPDKIMRI